MVAGGGISNYRVVQISKVRMNPYVKLLQDALCKEGISCSIAGGLSPQLVRSWRGTVDILHLHWLELLYTSPTLARSLRLLVAVLGGLVWAKVRGCKIVYTVHNLNPHEQNFPFLDRIAQRVLFMLADALHVHDAEAKLSVARVYGRRAKIYVVPHGSYIGAYPNNCTKQEARGRLALDHNAFVYLFLGQVRRYKGIEDLVTAFRQLADDTCWLVIAGHIHDPAYGEALAQLTRGHPKIQTWFQYVPDAEVQYFMNSCDVCVLPYRDVMTSGAAVLALSFGRPIIAPALDGFTELAADGRGILYNPATTDGLLSALQQARLVDMEEAGRKALVWAREYEWRILAPRFIDIYADILKARSREL